MLKLTVCFTVITASILIDKVDSSQHINIQNFLQALQQELKREQEQQRGKEHQHVYYKQDEENSYHGSLKKKDVDKIFNYLPRSEKKQRSSKNNQRKKQQIDQYYVRRPFSQGLELIPNDIIGLDNKHQEDRSSYEREDREDDDQQNEYSKVYVILNSEAIKKSKNKDKLNALLSSLLAPPPKQHRDLYQDELDQYLDKQDRHRNQRDRYQNKHSRYLVVDDRDQGKLDRHQDKRGRYQDENDRYQDDDKHVWFPDENDQYQDNRDRYQEEDDLYRDQHSHGHQDRQKDRRYKGFLINSNLLRRKMRGSGETFASLEQRPKPMAMRPREMLREKPRRGRGGGGGGGGGRGGGGAGRGGGGGGGGRTAIPYIRQHGDIYERED